MSRQPASGADNYQLGAEIARGGMGSVLKAEDAKLKRTVALKAMLMDADSDRRLRQRFIREAEVLAMLAHPNIVPIYDIVWEDGIPLFYTMKLVKGRTLQAILNDLRAGDADTLREFSLERLLGIFRSVCNAVAFAHSKAVLHRDLKPENVMVGEFGEVLVMDWGLAKIADTAGDEVGTQLSSLINPQSGLMTVHGAVLGTPQYMSPEQALGYIDELDERSDIFSLGGILYAILTLRPPVEGKTLNEVLAKVSTGQIASPSNLHGVPASKGAPLPAEKIKPLPHIAAGRVPASLSSVAMKALSLKKEGRYQSVVELGSDIEAYQGGFATRAEQAGTLKQIALLMRRHKGVTAALAAIVLLSFGFILKLIASEQRAVANEGTALQQKEVARRALAESSKSLAEAWLRESNGPAIQTVLDKVPEDLRDGLWRYLHRESDASIAHFPYTIQDVAAHPKLPSVFAIATDRLNVALVTVTTGSRLIEFTPGFASMEGTRNLRIAVSPDGELIAVGRDGPGGIVIHQTKDGAKVREWEAPRTTKLSFNSDLTLLMQTVGKIADRADGEYGSDNTALEIWNPSAGALLWNYRQPIWVHGFFTPDGKNALIEAWGDALHLVDAMTGARMRDLAVPDVSLSVSTSRDGQHAVCAQRLGYFQSVNLADGTSRFRNRIHNQTLYFVGHVPNSAQFVTIATLLDGRRDIRIWNSENGSFIRSLLGGRGWEHAAAVHPLSGELFVGGEDNRVWNLSGPPPKWILPGRLTGLVEFWGSDDTLFAPNGGNNSWIDISQSPPATLWPAAFGGYGTVFGYAGNMAVIGRPFEVMPITLVKRVGVQINTLGTFQPGAQIEERGVKLSPQGEYLAVRGKGLVEIFSVSQREQKPKVADISTFKSVRDIAWVLGGKSLIGIAEGKDSDFIVAWEPSTGRRILVETHHSASAVIAVAPDGKQFAEAGTDKNIRIRDSATLRIVKEFRGSNTPITAIAWHPHRPIIAVGSEDQSVKVWDFGTERRIDAFYQLNSYPLGLSFSPSGKRLAAAQINGALVWEPESLSGTTPSEFVPPARPRRPVPTVDTNGFTELMSTITPETLREVSKSWRLENGMLRSSQTWSQVLPLFEELGGKSYELKLRLRREPLELLSVLLPVGTGGVSLELDSYPKDGYFTGLTRVENVGVHRNKYSVKGPIFPDTQFHDLGVIVHSLPGDTGKVQVSVDGKTIIEWAGPISDLEIDRSWRIHPYSTLALGAHRPNWEIESAKLKVLLEK